MAKIRWAERVPRHAWIGALAGLAFFSAGTFWDLTEGNVEIALQLELPQQYTGKVCGKRGKIRDCETQTFPAGQQTHRWHIRADAHTLRVDFGAPVPTVTLGSFAVTSAGTRISMEPGDPGYPLAVDDLGKVVLREHSAFSIALPLDIPRPWHFWRWLLLSFLGALLVGCVVRARARGISIVNPVLGRPALVYTILAVTFGGAAALIVPPFEPNDEFVHFYRTVHIASGNLVPEMVKGKAGGLLPTAIADAPTGSSQYSRTARTTSADEMIAALRVDVDPRQRTFVAFHGASGYNPLPYAPQAAAIALGSALGLAPNALVYLGRLAALLVMILLVRAALSRVTSQAPALLLLCLCPTVLFRSATLATDGIIFAAALWFAVMVGEWMERERALGGKEFRLLFTFSCVLGLVKPGYLLIPFLALCLPRRVLFSSKSVRHAAIRVAAIIGPAIVLTVLWSGWIGAEYSSNLTSPKERPDGLIDAATQVRFAIQHPLSLLATFLRTFWEGGDQLARAFVAECGRSVLPLPAWFSTLWLCALIVLAMGSTETPNKTRSKVVAWGVLLASVGLIMAMLYATYTPLASEVVAGLSGRYFVALAPIAVFACRSNLMRFKVASHQLIVAVSLFSALLLLYVGLETAHRYYGTPSLF